MRMIFGLAGLLVTIGIIALLMNQSMSGIQAAKKARDRTEDRFGGISGNEGMRQTRESITLEPLPPSGRFKSLFVKEIVVGGNLERYFGLKKGDVITGIGGLSLDTFGDAEGAEASLMEAHARGQEVNAMRDGQAVILPMAANSNSGGKAKGPAGQLNDLIQIPTH